MILDIIIAAILILSMAFGLYRGFVWTCVHTVGWVGALIAAFFLTRPLADMLGDSFVGEAVTETVTGEVGGQAESVSSMYEGLPAMIRGGLTTATAEMSDILASLIAGAVISVISFLVIMVGIRLLLGLLTRSVARRDRGTLLSGGDRFLGLVAGSIKGLLLVFMFLILLIPIVNLSQGDFAEAVIESLRSSVIAGTLYDNNLLLVITGGIFS